MATDSELGASHDSAAEDNPHQKRIDENVRIMEQWESMSPRDREAARWAQRRRDRELAAVHDEMLEKCKQARASEDQAEIDRAEEERAMAWREAAAWDREFNRKREEENILNKISPDHLIGFTIGWLFGMLLAFASGIVRFIINLI